MGRHGLDNSEKIGFGVDRLTCRAMTPPAVILLHASTSCCGSPPRRGPDSGCAEVHAATAKQAAAPRHARDVSAM